MGETSAKNSDKQRSTSPDANGSANGEHDQLNDDQPSGNPYPPGGGFQGFYGYTPNEGAGGADGAAFFPFHGAVYQAFASGNGAPGLYPVNMSQLAASGQYNMQRQKRKQVKNACVNCSAACKKCDNTRPCERCKKYGIGETCLDSARKERKKGVKRGPYKRRLKPQQPGAPGDGEENPEGEWMPEEEGVDTQPTTVDPADLPNTQSGSQSAAGAFATPEGYYTYPYPYPFPPTADGQAPEGAYPAPPFFPHYPPYPPWGQPHPGFDVGGDEHHGGSARTSGAKKKRTKDQKKVTEAAKTAALLKKGETAAARASRAARRGGTGSGSHPTETELNEIANETLDLSAVTDPSLLAENHQATVESDADTAVMSLDPQATTKT